MNLHRKQIFVRNVAFGGQFNSLFERRGWEEAMDEDTKDIRR
jgi:hypothetical protein